MTTTTTTKTKKTTTLPRLNATQVLILHRLQDHPEGVARQTLLDEGLAPTNECVGPVDDENLPLYPDSLRAHGFVQPLMLEGRRGIDKIHWALTSRGTKVAGEYQAVKRYQGVKVPPDILDPLVKNLRSKRTYGMERFTNADIMEIQNQLPEEYEVGIDELRQQIVNRRKKGAYAPPGTAKQRVIKLTLSGFGPKGTLHRNLLTREQIETLEAMLNDN